MVSSTENLKFSFFLCFSLNQARSSISGIKLLFQIISQIFITGNLWKNLVLHKKNLRKIFSSFSSANNLKSLLIFCKTDTLLLKFSYRDQPSGALDQTKLQTFVTTRVSLSTPTFFSYLPDSNDYIFAWLPQSIHKNLEFLKSVSSHCSTSTSHISSSSSKDDDKIFFNATKFHRFDVHFFKLFSVQLIDQADSGSPLNTLLLHLTNQNHSLNISNDQNDTDAEKITKKKVFNVLTKTELDTFSSTEVSPEQILSAPHEYLGSPENFLNQPETHYSSSKFDANDELFFLKNETLNDTLTVRILTIFHLKLQRTHVEIFLEY